MPSPLKILFLDDHTGLRDSLGTFLHNKNPDFQFFYASTKDEAIEILSANPDLTNSIIDINLNGLNSLELIPQFRAVTPKLNIIVYTMFNDSIHIEQGLQKNIQGYVTKDAPLDEIEKAIICVSAGGIYFNKNAKSMMNSFFKQQGDSSYESFTDESYVVLFENYKTLTTREKSIFELLAQQKNASEVAEILEKSEKTITNQISIIYQKMGIHSRLELLKVAKNLGVII